MCIFPILARLGHLIITYEPQQKQKSKNNNQSRTNYVDLLFDKKKNMLKTYQKTN